MSPRSRKGGASRKGRRSQKSRPSQAGRGSGKGARSRKGVLSAIRLTVAVIVVTVVAAVGVNLSLLETDDIGTLADPAQVWTGERVRVEIFNVGGVTGMAREATETLRRAGFDVVTFDNARTFDPERPSEVIDRVGRTDIAQAVAAAMGIDNVQSDPDPNLFVEVTVLVGRDWVGPNGVVPTDSIAGAGTWWDPRSWF